MIRDEDEIESINSAVSHPGYMVVYCPCCKWPFHCPRAQYETREGCRACESRGKL